MLVLGQNSFGIDRFIGASVSCYVVIVDGPKRQHFEYRMVNVSDTVGKIAAAIAYVWVRSNASASHEMKSRNSVSYSSDWGATCTPKESWFDPRQVARYFSFFQSPDQL